MPSIVLKNIYKTFKTKAGRKDVLRDVSLEIPDKSFTVLTGESGAGKSTLLNMIGGLELPSSGEILINGQDISKLSGKDRTEFYRHQVGFVFQGFYLQPQLTLAENIALSGIFANMSDAECDTRTRELAQMLGIADVLNRKPEAVSGGQVERACIARALFMHPQIILADEPTNNLDPMNARNVVALFQQVWQQTGATMIIASHDERLFSVANQVLHVVDAQVKDITGEYIQQPAASATVSTPDTNESAQQPSANAAVSAPDTNEHVQPSTTDTITSAPDAAATVETIANQPTNTPADETFPTPQA